MRKGGNGSTRSPLPIGWPTCCGCVTLWSCGSRMASVRRPSSRARISSVSSCRGPTAPRSFTRARWCWRAAATAQARPTCRRFRRSAARSARPAHACSIPPTISTSNASSAARSRCSAPARRPSTTPLWHWRRAPAGRICSCAGRICRRSTSRSGRCLRASSRPINNSMTASAGRSTPISSRKVRRRRTSRCCAATGIRALPCTSPSRGPM